MDKIDLRVAGEAFHQFLINIGLTSGQASLVDWIFGALILLVIFIVLAILLIWLERKLAGRVQDRLGPNRVGPYGLIQPIADTVKLFTKEDITPSGADRITFNLAPTLAVFSIVMAFAVIPFADKVIGTDINVGVVYLMAFGSIGSMSLLMAGWASNNKYALLGGFRVVAQLMSYEIPMAFAMLLPVLLAGTMRMNGLVEAQGRFFGLGWNIWIMPAVFLIYLMTALAEGERAPFDLLEAESEIVAGYNIEYSGLKFAWFYLAFFMNTWVLSAVATTLFLGGWQGPFVEQLPALGVVYFLGKTTIMFVIFAWIRATFPRLRIDQMMSFCWKFLVPMVLVLFLLTVIILKLGLPSILLGLLLLISNVVVFAAALWFLGRGLEKSKWASKRLFTPEIPRL
jgi:NADH-quinone oxidoreductase subunit H